MSDLAKSRIIVYLGALTGLSMSVYQNGFHVIPLAITAIICAPIAEFIARV
jgi:hypothetical protein